MGAFSGDAKGLTQDVISLAGAGMVTGGVISAGNAIEKGLTNSGLGHVTITGNIPGLTAK